MKLKIRRAVLDEEGVFRARHERVVTEKDLREWLKGKAVLLLTAKHTRKESHKAVIKLGLLDELLAELEKEEKVKG